MVLAICGMLLNVFILPTVFDADSSVPRAHSGPTSVVLFVMSCAYVSLGLLLPSVSTFIGSALWAFVYQRRS
jgi:hypothetical protein